MGETLADAVDLRIDVIQQRKVGVTPDLVRDAIGRSPVQQRDVPGGNTVTGSGYEAITRAEEIAQERSGRERRPYPLDDRIHTAADTLTHTTEAVHRQVNHEVA